jgi:hypothetical protein
VRSGTGNDTKMACVYVYAVHLDCLFWLISERLNKYDMNAKSSVCVSLFLIVSPHVWLFGLFLE